MIVGSGDYRYQVNADWRRRSLLGVQGVFQHVEDVISAVSGYAGGARDTAQYETTSSGTTGHAESVQITFDPHRITYGRILQIYFSVAHDPTELNRQGPDVGTQYRSAVFPQIPRRVGSRWPISRSSTRPRSFRPRSSQPSSRGRSSIRPRHTVRTTWPSTRTSPTSAINDLPKIQALKKVFPDSCRETPVLIAAMPSAR
jgi:peptide-methionine (S)-S-oxide reductase